MSNGNSSYLRFSVEESIWFQKGHEVEELVSISLSPNVVIQETREYVLIKGSLELTGEYQSKLDSVSQPEAPAPGEKFMELLEVRNDGVCFFRYYFPVDITIRREKIANVHQVDFLVDNFDYTFPERSCLKLSANLFVTGLLEEALPKPEIKMFTQPAFFQPEAQVPRAEKYIPIPDTTLVVENPTREEEVGSDLEEVVVEEVIEEIIAVEEVGFPSSVEVIEERAEVNEEEVASVQTSVEHLEEIARLQEEELLALLKPLEEENHFSDDLEIEVVFENESEVEVVDVKVSDVVEEVNDYSLEQQLEEVLLEEEVEEVVKEQEEIAENEIEEQEVELVKELDELVEEMVGEIAPEPVMVEETPKKSSFGFDIFLSKKFNKKNDDYAKEQSLLEMKEDKKKVPPVKLTEFLGNKDNDGNINLKIYFIQPNDTLEKIAERYGTPLTQLLRYNKLDSAVDLVPGETLYVPRTFAKK